MLIEQQIAQLGFFNSPVPQAVPHSSRVLFQLEFQMPKYKEILNPVNEFRFENDELTLRLQKRTHLYKIIRVFILKR